MTQLRPQVSALNHGAADQRLYRRLIALRSEHQIPRFLRKARVSLHFADDRHGGAAFRPPFVKSDLRLSGITLTVPKGIRHRRLRESVF